MAQGGQLGAQCTRGQDLRAGRGGRAEEWRKAGSRGRAPQRPYSLKRALHAGATKREERASRAYRQDSQYGNQFTLCVGLESRTQYIMCVGGSTVRWWRVPEEHRPPSSPSHLLVMLQIHGLPQQYVVPQVAAHHPGGLWHVADASAGLGLTPGGGGRRGRNCEGGVGGTGSGLKGGCSAGEGRAEGAGEPSQKSPSPSAPPALQTPPLPPSHHLPLSSSLPLSPHLPLSSYPPLPPHLPSSGTISPASAASRELLPEPTSPTITVSAPRGTAIERRDRQGGA